jgi:hypothetical protein
VWTIENAWDNTDYWDTRYTSKVFLDHIATSGLEAEFFRDEFFRYMESDAYKAWEATLPKYTAPPPLDTGDYWAITFGAGIVEGSVVRDDYGNWYLRGGAGVNTGGVSVSRGDILVNTNSEGPPFQNLVDIDALNLSSEEMNVVARQALTGWSSSASGTYYVGAGGSSGLHSPYHATIEATLGPPGVSVTVWSYTFHVVWPR